MRVTNVWGEGREPLNYYLFFLLYISTITALLSTSHQILLYLLTSPQLLLYLSTSHQLLPYCSLFINSCLIVHFSLTLILSVHFSHLLPYRPLIINSCLIIYFSSTPLPYRSLLINSCLFCPLLINYCLPVHVLSTRSSCSLRSLHSTTNYFSLYTG